MYTTTLDAATLETLIRAAVAAPSIHNTQPWRYRLDPDTSTIEVRAAPERMLRHADPQGRALHISVGAAVFNLRMAVEHFGREPVVRLLPRPSEPGHLASVRVAGRLTGARSRSGGLYDAVWRRHSSRTPFSDLPVPTDVLTELARAADTEGARLYIPGTGETDRLLQLTAEAERFAVSDPHRRTESRNWVRDGTPDGLPGAVLGPQDTNARLPVRDFSALRPADQRPSARFEEHPVVAVLTTSRDHRADWLRAGQALERALLVATVHHVRASLLHQAVEWPDIRWTLRDPHAGGEHVQMLIRLGYGQEGPATPRRPVRDVLGDGETGPG